MNTHQSLNVYCCKFCGKEFNKKQAVAGHQTFCKSNPDYNKTIQKLKTTFSDKRNIKNPISEYNIICPKCGIIHVEKITKNNFEKGNYKKYCSSFCAHSASGAKTIKIKQKISTSIKEIVDTKLVSKICKKCGNSFETNIIAWNNVICKKCKEQERLNKRNIILKDDGKQYCKICGSLKTSNECLEICKRKKFIENFLIKCLKFDKNVLGNKALILKEMDKIKHMLYNDYYIDELSLNEISKKYNFKGFGNITTLFKMFDFKIRNFKSAGFLSYKNGKNGNQESFNRFKSGYHTSWNGQKFFLRSSYEFDFANELDKNKIEYEVEKLRIKYFDTQKNRMRIAIPDFYLPLTNEIIEIKSNWTYNKQNIIDKFKEYSNLGYKPKLILEHLEEKILF